MQACGVQEEEKGKKKDAKKKDKKEKKKEEKKGKKAKSKKDVCRLSAVVESCFCGGISSAHTSTTCTRDLKTFLFDDTMRDADVGFEHTLVCSKPT